MKYYLVDKVNSDLYSEFIRKLRESTIVAIDAEWVSEVPLCLLQFALRRLGNDDEVFVLDLVTIRLGTIRLGTVYDALKAMFTDEHIIKLGFRFKNDLRQITKASMNDLAEGSEMEFLEVKVTRYLAIEDVYDAIMAKNNPSWKKPKDMVGLATVCKHVLGEDISKEEQRSNWLLRPLKDEQVQYAAKDAWCLLQILDKLIAGNEIELNSLSFDELQLPRKDIASMGQKTTAYKEQKRRKDKPTKELTALTISTQSNGAGPKKFLCDETVEKLCCMLRAAGIDTGFFAYVKEANEGGGKGKREGSAKQLHPYGCSVEQAIKDQRILLTKKRGKKLDSFPPVLSVYMVDSGKRYKQFEEVIKIFDLKISEEDLMTRCPTCNELLVHQNCKNCGEVNFSPCDKKKLKELCKSKDCNENSIESSKNDRAATSDT